MNRQSPIFLGMAAMPFPPILTLKITLLQNGPSLIGPHIMSSNMIHQKKKKKKTIINNKKLTLYKACGCPKACLRPAMPSPASIRLWIQVYIN